MESADGAGMPTPVRRRFRIGGRVQMVGFRMYAVVHANRLALCGRVRNLPGGEVEVLAEGPPAAMSEFSAVLELGPALAEVTSFLVSEEPPGPPLGVFVEER